MTDYQIANLNDQDGLMAEIYLLPETLRAWREEAELTLKQLAERTGLSISFLSDIERGRTRPSLSTLEKLATAYQRTITIDIGFELQQETAVYTRNKDDRPN